MSGKARGHVLLSALILVTLMSVMAAMALQPVRTTNQRALEQELIYRGEHLAEGIRRFYIREGRFPFYLEEMLESEPRTIRQLYTDPTSKNGEWTLVYLQRTDMQALNRLNTVWRRMLDVDQESNSQNQEQVGLSQTSSVFNIKNQQITGIRPSSMEEGLTEYQESRLYGDWLFTSLPQEKKKNQNLLDRSPIFGGQR